MVLHINRTRLRRLFKLTEIKFDNLSDPDIYLFFEKGRQGGVSMISKRHGMANNPYMGDEYNHNKPNKYLTYLDAKNLYGWAMRKPLPTGNFKWMEEEDNFETNDSDITFIKRRFDATACIIFKL